ncbi:hypothetical protein BASA50_010475 [Batrachochytrium salamandrivorans]|uniref:Uncharacterized protein n=1 Tax=Batrachochytrium salamandrivorans TaxID=1357716 RepID=A0ABQ8EYY7_9FUNG|nr:hypothetical protein BASA50_010475 [Batrachochytrium salamandrivorans]KAH9264933.1 hypothetical protein BASA83_011524 [Batrachochytrium salamandrivorans]
MRISTGIILSMLSANVFAIEHPNGAHSGSLLARRAVVADTDDVFLQKRSGDKGKKKSVKSKTSVPSSSQENLFRNDSDSDSNPSDDTQEGPTGFPDYDPKQDDEDQGARNNVYAGLGSGRRRSRLSDAFGGSPSQTLGGIKKRLSRAKLGAKLFYSSQRAFAASEVLKVQFPGEEGKAIGDEVYKMLEYMAKTSQGYKELYSNPGTSPFRLELLSSTPYNLKEQYKHLQRGVKKSIKDHISATDDATGNISTEPAHVITWLEKIMETVDNFYKVVLDAEPKYCRLAELLGMSDTKRLEDLEAHIKAVGAYKNSVSEHFDKIKKMVEDYRESSKQEGPLNAFAPDAGV